jgi:hypothetical protein
MNGICGGMVWYGMCEKVLKMAFVIGVIPLPAWYIFLNAYGPELHPEDYRRYHSAVNNGNGNVGALSVDDQHRPLLRASPRAAT